MAAPRLHLGIVLDVLINEPVVVFLEAVSPAVADLDGVSGEDLDMVDAQPRCV
ncbi:hypothetical protein [Halomonas aquatica]|uniref:Uncharacterized protein n=1 Tax=Halomonas aquatica TaxID=3151123 RepID=A0ABV1NE02_9GAMM